MWLEQPCSFDNAMASTSRTLSTSEYLPIPAYLPLPVMSGNILDLYILNKRKACSDPSSVNMLFIGGRKP